MPYSILLDCAFRLFPQWPYGGVKELLICTEMNLLYFLYLIPGYDTISICQRFEARLSFLFSKCNKKNPNKKFISHLVFSHQLMQRNQPTCVDINIVSTGSIYLGTRDPKILWSWVKSFDLLQASMKLFDPNYPQYFFSSTLFSQYNNVLTIW